MQAILRTLRLLVLGVTLFVPAFAVAAVGAGAANAGSVYEIEFAPGSDHTSIDGAVVRGDADTFAFEARAGQTLTLDLSSVEGNARFTTSGPDGRVLCAEETWSRITLPKSGYYTISVEPSRGNATYTLSVRIV
ncbi:PPC domain-containing protein [Nocardia sp. NPDC019219]|uniref:PPC domain-containing protein n=1 Tax=Nocardia sp. NPDC019219 TaxID=3154590 RepID=UPI00340A686A